jgi:amino acid adenylation domain-containing protein
VTTSVWQLFARQAEAARDAPALRQQDQVWSYGTIHDEITALAAELRGVAGPGDVVAMSAHTPRAAIVTLLAAATTGAAVLPVNPDDVAARHEFQLADSGAVAMLSEAQPTAPLHVTPLSGGRSGSVPPGSAYLMYTSGSTGRPKGVVVSGEALADRLRGLAAVPGLRRGETMLALTSFTFDICLAELLLPLTVGATVVAASPDTQREPTRFAADLELHRPDVVQATPSFWRLAVAAGWSGGASRIWCGGETLSAPLARDLLCRCTELWNVYGPTEATIWVTAGLVHDPDRIRLGDALPGSEVRLLGPDGRPLSSAPGSEGEIVLTGQGIATGYLNRKDLTAAAFAPMPGSNAPTYRTGDYGRWTSDGLEFLGRRDGQVKVRGHRLELGEVEASLEGHPQVSEAVVFLARGDDPVRAHLVAAVVGNASPADLRAWLADRLPRVMLPRRVVAFPSLPRTTAGKVDRVGLASALGL